MQTIPAWQIKTFLKVDRKGGPFCIKKFFDFDDYETFLGIEWKKIEMPWSKHVAITLKLLQLHTVK